MIRLICALFATGLLFGQAQAPAPSVATECNVIGVGTPRNTFAVLECVMKVQPGVTGVSGMAIVRVIQVGKVAKLIAVPLAVDAITPGVDPVVDVVLGPTRSGEQYWYMYSALLTNTNDPWPAAAMVTQ